MPSHAVRIEHYYNALVGRGRLYSPPSIREARQDLARHIEAELPIRGA